MCVYVWCPLDGCDALIGQREKTTVQSQSVCTVHVYTQPWAQHKNIGMSVDVACIPPPPVKGVFKYNVSKFP